MSIPLRHKSPANADYSAVTASHVEAMIDGRRLRERYFGRGLFFDPAWDIFLQLYAAELMERRVLSSRLKVTGPLPATATRRALACLVERGMIEERVDPHCQGASFVFLSRQTKLAMDAFFGAVRISFV